jgi:hypothetical protein
MEGGVPRELLKVFHGRRPEALSLLVNSGVGFRITMFLAQLAEELGELFLYGVNYVNIRDSVRQLRHRFPALRAHFEEAASYQSWLVLPSRRRAPRVQLDILLELVAAGVGDGSYLPFDRSIAPRAVAESAPHDEGEVPIPILPEFEGIYAYVDRANRVPAMVLVDSLESLARHYGVSVVRLASTLQRDLVDPGLANVVATVEVEGDAVLETVFDGVVRLRSAHDPGSFPWSLSLEKLPGAHVRQKTYVLLPQRGRLVAPPSDRDTVRRLLGEPLPDRGVGLPREFLGFFGEPRGLSSDESTFFSGRPY